MNVVMNLWVAKKCWETIELVRKAGLCKVPQMQD
jgi:hypothetical protein